MVITFNDSGVYIGSGTIDASALLQLDSTTQAFVPSRMTTTQRDAMTPIAGAQIYNITTSEIEFYNGSAWTSGSGITASSTDTLTNKTFDADNNTFLNAGSLDMLKIGTPQYSTMKGIQSTTHSAGLVAGGAISNNGDGTIAVASGDGLIKSSDSDVADLYSCEWVADSSVALTNNSENYVYMQFVSTVADPTVATSTSKPTDLNTNLLLGSVYRAGNEIHITTQSSYNITNHIKKMIDRFQETEYFQHASGAALSETGTRNLATTSGTFWEGLNKFSTIAQDTSGASPDNNHTFEYFYRDGASGWTTHEETIDAVTFTGSGLNDATSGGTFVGSHTIRIHVEITATGTPDTFKWSYKGNDGVTVVETTGVAITAGAITLVDGITITFAATTGHTIGDAWDFDAYLSAQIDNTQYDNNSGTLATLSNNQYGVHWIYLDVHGHLAALFGQDSYALADAQDAEPPAAIPDEFATHSRLIGKIIIAKSGSTFTLIENNYGATFQGSVPTSHSDLTDLTTGDPHTQYSLISSGAGVPATTPSREGLIYVDTTANTSYISTGTASSADWTITGGSSTPTFHIDSFALTVNLDSTSGTYADIDATNVKQSVTLVGGETIVAEFFVSRMSQVTSGTATYKLVAGTTDADVVNEVTFANTGSGGSALAIMAKWSGLGSGTFDFKPQFKTSAGTARISADSPITWKVTVYA